MRLSVTVWFKHSCNTNLYQLFKDPRNCTMFPDLIKNALLLDGIKYENNLIEIEVVELKHTIKTAHSLSNLVCDRGVS